MSSTSLLTMTNPEITKKISTPTYPPEKAEAPLWKSNTGSTATALRPSTSLRYLNGISYMSGPFTPNVTQLGASRKLFRNDRRPNSIDDVERVGDQFAHRHSFFRGFR